MTRHEFLSLLTSQPLVVSVQGSEGSPADETGTLHHLAKASVAEGIRVLRLESEERVRAIRSGTGAHAIGLVKRKYNDSPVYITSTSREVDELLATGCEVIALDGTPRPRPNGERLPDLVEQVHAGGRLVMADCDSLDSALFAEESGADFIGTTLAGYTESRSPTVGPDLELLRQLIERCSLPVIAEGRFTTRKQVEVALRIGATAVVVGGSINDPTKNTRGLLPHVAKDEPLGAVDIGGTWIRFGVFSSAWELLTVERSPLPPKREDRQSWIERMRTVHKVRKVAVSTGGIVDPRSGEVWEAKDIIPNHVGTRLPYPALNDGLAAAWGHANLPQFAGKRVATLALGTGVGVGFVADHKIWMGPRGEYPRLNDLPLVQGKTVEEILGGLKLGPEADGVAQDQARLALEHCVQTIRALWFTDDIVVCGAVGLADWLRPAVAALGLTPSPFGPDAGLYGAAALSLFPPFP